MRRLLARKELRKLRISRFVVDRWKFFVCFRCRRRKAAIICAAFIYYHFRCAYLVIKKQIHMARKIQHFYRWFKFRKLSKMLVQVLRKTHAMLAHCFFFAERRAARKLIIAELKLSEAHQKLGKFLLAMWKEKLRRKRLAM